jgi:creatinine amidohydrolase
MTSTPPPLRLAELTTREVEALLAAPDPLVAILPVGSVEPHGPHLPLATDTILSEGAAARGIALLAERGVRAVLCPSVPYGVTDFAAGFAGAVSLRADALTAFLRALAESLLAAGFAHVCLVNNHLEPAHDAAIRAVADGLEAGRVSIACPLARRHARTLSAEFKSGACHAGEYETSMVMAIAPALVREEIRRGLTGVPISLSEGISAGKATFQAMGMRDAYAGTPASATAAHGEEQLHKLGEMIALEVVDALAKLVTASSPEGLRGAPGR